MALFLHDYVDICTAVRRDLLRRIANVGIHQSGILDFGREGIVALDVAHDSLRSTFHHHGNAYQRFTFLIGDSPTDGPLDRRRLLVVPLLIGIFRRFGEINHLAGHLIGYAGARQQFSEERFHRFVFDIYGIHLHVCKCIAVEKGVLGTCLQLVNYCLQLVSLGGQAHLRNGPVNRQAQQEQSQ